MWTEGQREWAERPPTPKLLNSGIELSPKMKTTQNVDDFWLVSNVCSLWLRRQTKHSLEGVCPQKAVRAERIPLLVLKKLQHKNYRKAGRMANWVLLSHLDVCPGLGWSRVLYSLGNLGISAPGGCPWFMSLGVKERNNELASFWVGSSQWNICGSNDSWLRGGCE